VLGASPSGWEGEESPPTAGLRKLLESPKYNHAYCFTFTTST